MNQSLNRMNFHIPTFQGLSGLRFQETTLDHREYVVHILGIEDMLVAQKQVKSDCFAADSLIQVPNEPMQGLIPPCCIQHG